MWMRKRRLMRNARVEMTRLAIQDNIYFEIETIELERNEKSYTYDTIQLLKKRNPNTEYYFIIGGDMVDYLPTWHRVDELVHEVHLSALNVRDTKKKRHIQCYGLPHRRWILVRLKFEKMFCSNKVLNIWCRN